ncbi:MAG: IS66 family insertion sequence element accessory protein TnpA [Bryobacteraceae bacterium]
MQKGAVHRGGEKRWRERVSRQRRSGHSVREFCQREGVSQWSFYRWRLRLRGAGVPARPERPGPKPVEPAKGRFIDLGPVASSESMAGRFEIRLELGDGVVLHLGRR